MRLALGRGIGPASSDTGGPPSMSYPEPRYLGDGGEASATLPAERRPARHHLRERRHGRLPRDGRVDRRAVRAVPLEHERRAVGPGAALPPDDGGVVLRAARHGEDLRRPRRGSTARRATSSTCRRAGSTASATSPASRRRCCSTSRPARRARATSRAWPASRPRAGPAPRSWPLLRRARQLLALTLGPVPRRPGPWPPPYAHHV